MKTILASGSLKQKMPDGHRRVRRFTMGLLDESYLPGMMALQNLIVQHLHHPDLLQAFSYDFMRQHLGCRGMVLGVLVDDRLVAFRNIYYPPPWDTEWNLGIDLGLPAEELSRVANLQMVCVHPQFRGNALGYRMNQVSLDLLAKSRQYDHICATVAPDNIWNIPVLLKSGFHIIKLKKKYGGKKRYIVYRNLHAPVQFGHCRAVYVRLDDHATQKQLFDCGLIGVAQHHTGRQPHGKSTSHCHLVFKPPLVLPIEEENLTQPLRQIQI